MIERKLEIDYLEFDESGNAYSAQTVEVQVPIKYKHCCGNIDNQRKAMVVRRYIANKIHEVLSRKKISKLHALVNFFKKKS